jgi:hypothetical protein
MVGGVVTAVAMSFDSDGLRLLDRLFAFPENTVKISRAVQYANDFDDVSRYPVEDQMLLESCHLAESQSSCLFRSCRVQNAEFRGNLDFLDRVLEHQLEPVRQGDIHIRCKVSHLIAKIARGFGSD